MYTRIIREGDSASEAQEIKKYLNHRMIRRGKCELPTASSLLRIYIRLKSWDCLLWKHRPPAGHSLGKMLIGTSQR